MTASRIFAIDPSTGGLTPVGWEPTQGQHAALLRPRPDAAHVLYAANQNSDTVVIFRVDQTTGTLDLDQSDREGG